MTALTPLRREVLVDADPDIAFRVFTEQIGTWWPLAEFSLHGAGSAVAFVDGAIVETSAGREAVEWGRVEVWEPPATLAFTWYPGRSPRDASRVRVTFTAAGRQTLVRLEHEGWEVFADPAAAREEYGHGWPGVLEQFRAKAGEATWVALVHRPGPDAPDGSSLFADPRFADHRAFLDRMIVAGYLVAAGPLADEAGTGMTVLRLPGAGRLDEAHRLATEDDRSVASGFFEVDVRPWQVVVSG